MAAFPDVVKDPADVITVTLDWTAKLPAGLTIASAINSTDGNVEASLVGSPTATAVKVQLLGGDGAGWTGDPQYGALSIVTCAVTLNEGSQLSRSFNVILRTL